MNQLQRKLSNGTWYDESRTEQFLSMAAEHNGITTEEAQAKLDAGEQLRYDPDDWYPYIRYKPAPRVRKPRPAAEWERICRHCGGSEYTGAMFTTDASSGYCDDCYN